MFVSPPETNIADSHPFREEETPTELTTQGVSIDSIDNVFDPRFYNLGDFKVSRTGLRWVAIAATSILAAFAIGKLLHVEWEKRAAVEGYPPNVSDAQVLLHERATEYQWAHFVPGFGRNRTPLTETQADLPAFSTVAPSALQIEAMRLAAMENHRLTRVARDPNIDCQTLRDCILLSAANQRERVLKIESGLDPNGNPMPLEASYAIAYADGRGNVVLLHPFSPAEARALESFQALALYYLARGETLPEGSRSAADEMARQRLLEGINFLLLQRQMLDPAATLEKMQEGRS